jgi:hypothetical protein
MRSPQKGTSFLADSSSHNAAFCALLSALASGHHTRGGRGAPLANASGDRRHSLPRSKLSRSASLGGKPPSPPPAPHTVRNLCARLNPLAKPPLHVQASGVARALTVTRSGKGLPWLTHYGSRALYTIPGNPRFARTDKSHAERRRSAAASHGTTRKARCARNQTKRANVKSSLPV